MPTQNLPLLVMPEASHWIVHEQPARVVATIRHLLAGPPTRPA